MHGAKRPKVAHCLGMVITYIGRSGSGSLSLAVCDLRDSRLGKSHDGKGNNGEAESMHVDLAMIDG